MLSLFKLEKLKIDAYKKVARGTGDFIKTYEVMFNPESFKESYKAKYNTSTSVGASATEAGFIKNEPADITLNLVIDGTGVTEMGIAQFGDTKTVNERVTELLQHAYSLQGETHEPNFLVLKWGDINIPCRLSKIDINYTNFDRDGMALRADITAVFTSELEMKKRLRLEDKTSPDLTHKRLVAEGDTLPMLSREIYGSSKHYLFIAKANNLDDFRNLQPGQELLIPPLASE